MDCLICGILSQMSEIRGINFKSIYARFNSPIASFDCGQKCAPYNEHGVPFCCDLNHAVPTAYDDEWIYLNNKSRLWQLFEIKDAFDNLALNEDLPEGQVLIKCLGHEFCQRQFRSITCRAFPFYPYLTLEGEFIGLSYYWQYEERCWVINNLKIVNPNYVAEFVRSYDTLFDLYPSEVENFRYHAIVMRRLFGRRKRRIPLLHRNGMFYKVTTRNGNLRKINPDNFSLYGPYKIAACMQFPEEEK